MDRLKHVSNGYLGETGGIMIPEDILRKPYARTFLMDPESGVYTALILEFPGCISDGPTLEEANANLNRVAESWLLASHAQGLKIPEPFENRQGVMKLTKLWDVVVRWRDKHQVTCEEAIIQTDDVNLSLPDLAEAALKVTGYLEE